MAARSSRDTQRARTEAERSRRYQARTAWFAARERRRSRDNLIAGVAGGLLIIAALGSQMVHAQATAPKPSPSPTATASPQPSATPSATPDPTPTVEESTTP